jgi:Domain of unknown function (DUF4402)
MKTTIITRSIFIGLMAIIAIVFAAQNSQAAPAQTTLIAPVELVGTITITSPVAVNFGRIVPPTAVGVTESYTVNSDGTTTPPAGGTGEFVPGTAARGQVRVTGPNGTTVDLSSNINTATVDCVPVSPATGTVILSAILFETLGSDVLVRTAGMNGSPQTIFMGGTLDVPNGATGVHNCSYNVDVVFTP